MNNLPQNAKPAKKSLARKKRSPLGEFIARVLNPQIDMPTVVLELFGSERGERILRAATHVRWADVAPDSGPVEFEDNPVHSPNDASSRRFVAHLIAATERLNSKRLRACSPSLFRGHTHEISGDGERVYVPAARAGGLAARFDCSPRTLDRHCAVMEAAGLFDVWQPPAADLPKDMRGKEYAYAIYEWCGALPRTVSELIARWWGKKPASSRPKEPQAAAKPAASSPAPQDAPRAVKTTENSAKLAQGFLYRAPITS
jgi:hypothetical protein